MKLKSVGVLPVENRARNKETGGTEEHEKTNTEPAPGPDADSPIGAARGGGSGGAPEHGGNRGPGAARGAD